MEPALGRPTLKVRLIKANLLKDKGAKPPV